MRRTLALLLALALHAQADEPKQAPKVVLFPDGGYCVNAAAAKDAAAELLATQKERDEARAFQGGLLLGATGLGLVVGVVVGVFVVQPLTKPKP